MIILLTKGLFWGLYSTNVTLLNISKISKMTFLNFTLNSVTGNSQRRTNKSYSKWTVVESRRPQGWKMDSSYIFQHSKDLKDLERPILVMTIFFRNSYHFSKSQYVSKWTYTFNFTLEICPNFKVLFSWKYWCFEVYSVVSKLKVAFSS